ncbi:MAG: restriction endonuclease subunit S [Desulfatirhabdiaceae bacterium]
MNKQTARLLEQHFDTAFAAPDGIAKLRELILTLAMQGKLVEQDPNDPPASELLKEIEAQKLRLVKAGIFRNNDDKLPNGSICPFQLPKKGWEWASVQQLGFVLGGKRLPKGHTYSESPTSYRYLTVTNMKNATIIDSDVKYITQETHEKIKNYVISKDDIYITIAGTIGAVGIIPEYCDGMNFTENASRLVVFGCDKLFLVHLLNSGIVQDQFAVLTNKMAQPKLSLRSILSTGVPLPPLREQHRIVARIEQLMARCDELEKLRKDREKKRLAVHTAAIRQLLDAPDGSAWNFIQQRFGELYTVKDNVAELRKAILQLAVMGRLVPQDPNDPPASELLKEIKAEKQRLVKADKIKQSKPLPPIKLEEVPYPLPRGWEWVRFGDLTTEIATGPFGSMIHKIDYVLGGIPLINPSHMIDGRIVHDPSISVSLEMAKKLDSYKLYKNDIVMARRGEMGRCAIVTNDSDGFLCGTGSFVLRFVDKMNRQYILNLFKTENVREYLGGNSVGTTMTNLNHNILNNIQVLLPPLPEQHRIVARIDQLMALCDTLEQQIDAATGKQTELLNAVMAQVGA